MNAVPVTDGTVTAGTVNAGTVDSERTDLLEMLFKHRLFLKMTVQGLTHEQAVSTPTVSELCLGGLIKHVAKTESGWADFIEHGPSSMAEPDEAAYADHADGFRLLDGETVESALAYYDEVAARTDALVTSLPDLGASQELPPAPWFEPGARWSARRVLMHIIAETAQHTGHADIIRETIDGTKSMG